MSQLTDAPYAADSPASPEEPTADSQRRVVTRPPRPARAR